MNARRERMTRNRSGGVTGSESRTVPLGERELAGETPGDSSRDIVETIEREKIVCTYLAPLACAESGCVPAVAIVLGWSVIRSCLLCTARRPVTHVLDVDSRTTPGNGKPGRLPNELGNQRYAKRVECTLATQKKSDGLADCAVGLG